MPRVAAMVRHVSISESKKPDFFVASEFLSHPLSESQGYFTMDARVAKVRRNPPRDLSLKLWVRVRKALALPSKYKRSRCWLGLSSASNRLLSSPVSSRKKLRMASSPE